MGTAEETSLAEVAAATAEETSLAEVAAAMVIRCWNTSAPSWRFPGEETS